MKGTILILVITIMSCSVFAQNGRSEKRGIAYGNHSEADLAAISGGLSWWYNWYHQPDSKVAGVYQNYNMDFVPMTWNNSFNEAGMRAYYAAHPEAKYLLAFNEPNFTAQANMKPSQVAAAWPRLEAIAQDFNLEIVGPAVNWCGDCVTEDGVKFTNPYAYLDTFLSICPDCKVDYIAVHNYMCYTGALSSYIDGFKKYGKKIWLTEYACWDQSNITLTMQKNLMKGSIDYLENDTMVFRYAWFTGNRSGAYPYLDIYAPQSGKLTELGQFYVDYKAFVPDTNYFATVPVRIEAEHYSKMKGISTEAVTDFDGVDNVGWIDPGDWLEYNIDIPATGDYYIYFRISSNAATSIILKIDGQNSDTLIVPYSGGWQSWKTLGLVTELPEGKHSLMAYAPSGNFNLNWIRISDHPNTPPVVFAGDDQLITLPSSANLVAIGSDNENDILKYKWTKISGPATFTLTGPNSDNTDVTNLVKGKYTFRVTVSDGTDLAYDQVLIDAAYAVGMDDADYELQKVYPNPVVNTLFVQNYGLSENTVLTISDPTGRQLFTREFTGHNSILEVDMSSFKNGFYILKVSRDSESFVQPVIKL